MDNIEAVNDEQMKNIVEIDDDIDPIHDIIDYLVRCTNISFKTAHVDEAEVKTSNKIKIAFDLYQQSASNFLIQFGKYLTPHHVNYFKSLHIPNNMEGENLKKCIKDLIIYHSKDNTHKRIRNRRYQACLKMQKESDYFSEKEMMYRSPLLYEQLIGQYLTDEEIRIRDGTDSENLTLLGMILETVDRNKMRETKNEQLLFEDKENPPHLIPTAAPRWGEFETTDTQPSFKPERRKQIFISAPERRLLREEFEQEMFSSFIDGNDADIDYSIIDNDEQFDDLGQLSQDAEDKYFDSEPTDVENLEEHMKLIEVYGKEKSNDNTNDTLDEFMDHLNKIKVNCSTYFFLLLFNINKNIHVYTFYTVPD